MPVLRGATVTLKLSRALEAKLTRLAKKRQSTRSDVLRAALEALGEAGPSPLDAIADLVGAVDGPSDLSTNPKHMEGFGRDAGRHRSHRRAS